MIGGLVSYYGTPPSAASVWYNYGSRHSGIVQFAMADGAVRPVRKGVIPDGSLAWYNFIYASGWRDGMQFEASTIGN